MCLFVGICKGRRNECKTSYRGIIVPSVPGKIYGSVLTERIIQITEEKVIKEQDDFRKGKECVQQIFAMKILAEKDGKYCMQPL